MPVKAPEQDGQVTGGQQQQPDSGPQVPSGATWLVFDPEVGAVLHSAVQEGWAPDRLSQALQQTAAYAETRARRQAMSDPATAEQTRSELALEISRMLDRPTTDPAVQAMTGRLANGQATMAGVQSLLAPVDQGTPVQRVVDLAAAHGVPMSAATARQWSSFDEQQVDEQLGQMSQSLYPWKPRGVPYAQFASVFQDVHQQELGQPVAQNDPRFQDLLAQSQGQLGAYRDLVRQLPEWERTPQAQQLVAQRTSQVVQQLLNGDGVSEEMARNRQAYEQQALTQMATALEPVVPTGGEGGGSSGGGGGGGGTVATGGGKYSVGSFHGLSAAEAWIIQHESGGNPEAQNPHSTAYGGAQFLDTTWAGTGIPKTSDPELQLKAFRIYYRQRYGTAEAAMRFWQAHNWY